jgi:hypothetical protein
MRCASSSVAALGDLAVVLEQAADGVLVVSGDVGGQPPGERQQLLVRHDVVDQPEPERLVGGQEVSGQGQLDGAPQPHRLRHEHGDPAAGHDPQPGVGIGEPGPLRGDQERALQGDLQPARHRPPP